MGRGFARPAYSVSGTEGGVSLAKLNLVYFCRSLEVMLRAGLPLHSALRVLEKGSSEDERPVYGKLLSHIENGHAFSDALAQLPSHFPSLLAACVRVAENSGRLHEVFGKVCEFLERKDRLKGKVVAALIYPAVLLSLTVFVVLGVVCVVLPREAEFLEGMGVEMPYLTKILVRVVSSVTHPAFLLIGLAVGSGIVFLLKKTVGSSLKEEYDHFVMQLPIIGSLLRDANAVILLQGTAFLVDAGLPLFRAMQQLSPAIENSYLRNSLSVCLNEIEQGESPSQSLKRWNLLPPTQVGLIRVAEEEGSYVRACLRGGQILESDLSYRLETLAALLEPAALIIMALVVGFVVLSTALPTAQLLQNI